MALTAKQDAFALKFFEVKVASEAYRLVYNAKKMSDKHIYDEASKLCKHPDITRRIQELKDNSSSKVLIDRDYITGGILKNIKIAEQKEETNSALKGYEMLSKMYDLNEDRQNDRIVSNKERAALVENFRKRMLDVTEEE